MQELAAMAAVVTAAPAAPAVPVAAASGSQQELARPPAPDSVYSVLIKVALVVVVIEFAASLCMLAVVVDSGQRVQAHTAVELAAMVQVIPH
jgi:hypothetical protein